MRRGDSRRAAGRRRERGRGRRVAEEHSRKISGHRSDDAAFAGPQVVKTVRDELTTMLGKRAKPLFASKPPWCRDCGFAGSGKTTTTGKLAKWLTLHGHRPLVMYDRRVSPAAREQLAQVAKAVGTAIWPGAGTDKPLEILKGAIKEAKCPRERRDPGGHRGTFAH